MAKLKTKAARILRSPMTAKILACSLIFFVLITAAVVPSFAADEVRPVVYQTLAPLSGHFAEGDYLVQAFPDTSDPEIIASNAITDERYLTQYLVSSDYTSSIFEGRLKYMNYNGSQVPYIEIFVACSYSHIVLNGTTAYQGFLSAPTGYTAILDRINCFEVSGPTANFVSGSSYYYSFAVLLYDINGGGYDLGYREGYSDGYTLGSSEGSEQSYNNGYNAGFADGRDATDSENLGQNLLGDTLSAPMDALNSFTLYKSSSGFEVTLGLVVGGVISLSLLLAFLKLFAGG